MKKELLLIASAAVALAGCSKVTDVNPDVPMIEREKIESFSGSGTLMYFGDDGSEVESKSTYTWSAEGQAINIIANVDLEEAIDRGSWEVGHFTLDVSQINTFLGTFVGSALDESTFYGLEPDGSVVEEMTSYKPGMWVNAEGYSCGYSDGVAFWQWYVWEGKTDKDGDTIGYDYSAEDYPGLLYLGCNPGNLSGALSGASITCKNIIVVDDTNYEFNITFKYSEAEIVVPDSEGYIEEYMTAANAYPYGSGVWGNHQYHWYFDDEGLKVDADLVSTADAPIEDWGVLGIVIPTDVMTAYLGIDDINKLADLEYFYPLQADGTAYLDGDSQKAWTSYAPGQWVDANGDGSNWQGIFFWQYQFGDYKYDGHFTEGLLVIGVNPGNIATVAGQTVTAKAQLGDKLMTVSVNFYDAFPTSKTGTVGAHNYSWTLGDSAIDIVANCSIALADDSWNWFGFCINEAYINAKYGIDIDTVSADITQFYPTDAAGTAYDAWTSYVPGEWFAADGSAGDWSSGAAFWQYYTYTEYDYAIPNLVLIGNNPGNVATQASGDSFVSKAKLSGNDWTVTVNIID